MVSFYYRKYLSMDLTKFDFELPTEQIAQFPKIDRASSKLLVVANNESFHTSKFLHIIKYLRPNDVVILNEDDLKKL